ncbi:hypothetical protein [Variovorax sp. GT1P44]|uniref:hypothetical protein n=1 Tax=Variovorax sp. GT1P44 TaxID=3443742 RepID=UPI003F464ADB
MTRNVGAARQLLALLLPATLWGPIPCAADAAHGTSHASAHLQFSVTLPPVLRILQVRRNEDGIEIHVWTNMRSVVLSNREFRFHRVGEHVLHLPDPADAGIWIVHGL